jgi:hypothetical protein
LLALAGASAIVYGRNRDLRPQFRTIVAFVLAFLLIGEIAFRVSFFGIDSLVHPLRYVPASVDYPVCRIPLSDKTHTGFKANSVSRVKGAPFRTNNFGFRDKDRSLEKGRNSIRIVVTGASMLMGAGVGQEEVFTAVLEKLLNQNDASVEFEVINLSRGAYQTVDMLDVLEKWGLRFDPDIILVRGISKNVPERTTLRRIRRHDPTTYELLKSVYHFPYSASFFFQAIRSRFFFNVVNEMMNALRRVGGTEVYTGGATDRPPLEIEEITRESREKYHLQEKFVALAGERRLFFLRIGRLASRDQIIFVGDNHPNAKTHRLYAEVIYEHLQPTLQELKRTIHSARR